MKKHSVLAGLALALLAGSAFAADLPSRKAAIIEPPPPFTWTGLYGGVNIGYGFGNGDRDPGFATTAFPGVSGIPAWTISNDLNGVLGGGQVGYNYQFNPWLVVGLEADVQATDVHSQGIGVGASPGATPGTQNFVYATQNKSVDWFGTVRGRVGLTLPSFPNLMVYGAGGFAYGNVIQSANASDFFPAPLNILVGAGSNYDSTHTGWTVGGGVEWFPLISNPLFKAFSVKLEYLYTDLGSTTVYGGQIAGIGATPALTALAAGSAFTYQQSSWTRFHTVRVGVNWHFNPFAAAPVLAKY